ncbi:MAG TPA: efflux RND transporter permease subunit, partial [Candidatus Kapabacteria bacterium]|nr:efflux RND transporter permease subunit [Candidatus Kapabacteria bacterium]
CKIFGEDLDTLANYAEKLGVIIQTVQGAKDIYVEKVTGLPQIVITYNREAMARYGINIREANKIVRAGLAGESTGMVYEGERRFDLMVRIDSSKRTDITDIGNIPIMTASGVQIPLSHIAYVSIKDGVNQIQREDAKRRIIIGFNVRERDVQSLVEELRTKVNKSMTLPVGYKITYGGQFENLEKAKQRLLIAVPAALILILVMLYFAFRSLRYGFLIFTAIPLSAIGGIIALWSRGMPFSISAGVGFIALFGVAVLNGIVLMAEFARLQQTGLRNLPFIVMRGTRLRLRPVLMTAAVASLGFLPMALSNGAGAEVQRPLATVVIGGLITSTLLTLIVLPIMYIRMEKMIHSRHHRKKIHTISAIIIVSIVSATPALTQPILTEEMALRMADTYNGELRQSAAYTAAAQALRGAASLTIPKTDISMEYGNVNTFNTDTKISIEQRFAFPTFYSAQNKLATAHAESIAEQERLTKADIYKKVKMSLLMLSRLEQEKKLLYSMDT